MLPTGQIHIVDIDNVVAFKLNVDLAAEDAQMS